MREDRFVLLAWSVSSTVAVAVVGQVATVLIAWQGWKRGESQARSGFEHAEKMAERSYEQQRTLARDERNYASRRDAYVGALAYTAKSVTVYREGYEFVTGQLKVALPLNVGDV